MQQMWTVRQQGGPNRLGLLPHQIFNGMQEEIVIRVCFSLKPMTFLKGDFVFKV